MSLCLRPHVRRNDSSQLVLVHGLQQSWNELASNDTVKVLNLVTKIIENVQEEVLHSFSEIQ